MNYLDKLKHLHSRSDTGSTFEAGSKITWTRADGSIQTGVVDFLYTDTLGTKWAFCTLQGGTWAAVNLKSVKGGLK